jgi:hypothetical protein
MCRPNQVKLTLSTQHLSVNNNYLGECDAINSKGHEFQKCRIQRVSSTQRSGKNVGIMHIQHPILMYNIYGKQS